MSNPITTAATATASASTAAIPVSSGQGPGPGIGGGVMAGTGGPSSQPGNSTHVQGGQGQLAQLLQQAAAAASGHGTNGNSVASLSSTIAASGLVLLPPPPLTSKNLTIHTSLLSTKQQLMQQQQQLQQLHHAQLNAALKKQQQQHQRQIQQQQQQQQQYDLQLLSPEDCSPSALSDGTMGEGIERDAEGMSVNAGEGDRALHSQPTTRSTTRVTSPTSAFAPGYPLLSSQGDGGMDHYPPPDQWNYTMTRYHASLIPLCQIEEPPTFYEGMDDQPPVETDNDDSDSFFLEERDIRERGTDRSRDRDRDREREYNNSDENISLSSIAKPHPQTLNYSHHDLTSHSQEHLQQHQEVKRLKLQDEAREGHASHVLQSSGGQSYRTSLTKDEHDKTRLDQEASLSLSKQQRRRDRTIDSSGEQIFFYDGPNLLHAKLHSGSSPDPVKNDGSTGPRIPSSTGPFNNINGHSEKPLQRPRSQSRSRSRSGSRSRSRSITGNSVVSTRSRSHSRSTSGALSRTISGYLAKKDLLPSSIPPATKTRPSILMRGFSADSSSRSDNDQKNRGAVFATGLTTTTGVNESSSGGGSVRRKATAKERLVAMVTRGVTGASTVSSGSKDFGNAGAHESSLPIKAHRNSMDERSSPHLGHSPILSQTHSRRQGSPSVGRAGYHEYVGLSTGTGASSPPDTMMGFPYNNSSLLMSTDITRGTPPTKVAPTLRTSRSNKPRPFSVATMEKLMASNGNRHDAYPHGHKEELSPGQEKHRSLHPHDLPFRSQQAQYRQHQHSVSNDVLVRGNAEDMELRSKIVSSGSHPLLSTLGSPSSPTSGGLSSPPFSTERRDSKGKEAADRSNERLGVSSSKALKTTTTPEPALNDLSSSAGAVLVHEHHIHHHYYCQHCPPLIQANADDLLDLEQQYNNTAAQRHLRRRPESKSFVPSASEYRQGRPLILDTTMSASPTTEHGYGSFATGFEDGNTTKHPIVQNKKKSILGTMSMTSSMRKRFFAEQTRELLQQQGQGRRGSERQVSPLSSSISGFDREDEAYSPLGANTRMRRNQGQPLLEGLSDDDDEFGPGNSSNIQGTQRASVLAAENGQQEQQRAKFLSRLKRFLLRPSPFTKSPPTPTAGSQINSLNSTPATPIDMRAAATVRVTKTRWARSGNNLQDHLAQDDLDADRSSLEGQLFYYPSQRESRRRWTHQEMFEPPAAAASAPLPTLTTPRREKLGIRAQFQQQQSSSQPLSPVSPTEVHPHHHHQHHHHHHHHDHPPGHDHQHHQHLHLAQAPLTAQQQPPQSSPAAVDSRSAADSNSRRSPKSAISVLSSLPMSVSATTHEKELSDHDAPPTPCSTAPSNVATTKEMKNATAAMSFNNASAL